MNYDEARHGINAYEMIRNEDYLVSTFMGQPDYWNLKPPLSYWCIALCYQLFGYTAFALRFYSAFLMLLCTLALCLWMARRFGLAAAFIATLAIAANECFYGYHFVRFADADAQFQCLFTLAMLCMLQSHKNINWLYGSAIGFGLAFLSKSVHAVSIPAVCFVYLLCDRRLGKLTWKRFLGMLAAGLAPILIWAVARYARDGWAFLAKMITLDVTGRIANAESVPSAELPALLFYMKYFFTNPAVLCCLVTSALCYLLVRWNGKRLSGEEASAALGCALWAAVPVALFTISNVKTVWYVFSTFLALPAMTAVFVQAAVKRGKPGVPRAVAASALLGVLICATAINVQTVARQTTVQSYQEMMRLTFDRELDAGKHVYIQYNESDKGEKIQKWMPGDMLAAMLYGDVQCLHGGAEAFAADEESAMLLMGRSENSELATALSEAYPVKNEDYNISVYENLQ
ncbi:MAG: glycosyltransferase family 39 protein [Clostridia bacterium]